MKKILNLTQHITTLEQQNDGVFEPKNKQSVISLLTFHSLPNEQIILERSNQLTEIVKDHHCDFVMIGGAPFLMSTLEKMLISKNIKPLYSFSERIVIEKTIGNETQKTSIFKHVGWVEIK